jgi:type II secretory ATPase GspE/PulE/Tfp pilus assembly ATPase PilB-like protein
VQAALTGHLVLSTLHTNDAPSAVTRLLDLGIEPFLITSSIVGVLAQRLVRVNCPSCSVEAPATPEELVALDLAGEPERRLRAGPGCLHCRQTGYCGRDGVFEVMPLTERLRRMVAERVDAAALLRVAREEGMRTLREAAREKVLAGVTTVGEMLRVT